MSEQTANNPSVVRLVKTADLRAILAETAAERDNRGARSERLAIRISPETLQDLTDLGEALGLRGGVSQRLMMPDIIKVAISTATLAVLGDAE